MSSHDPTRKARILQALVAELQAQLERMAAIAEDTRRGATHEENRSEGDKDMRATEQSYIARGQAMRVEAIADQLQRLTQVQPTALGANDAIRLYTLVTLERKRVARTYYLSPFGAGVSLDIDGERVVVLGPESPLGEQLLGTHEGDLLEDGTIILTVA